MLCDLSSNNHYHCTNLHSSNIDGFVGVDFYFVLYFIIYCYEGRKKDISYLHTLLLRLIEVDLVFLISARTIIDNTFMYHSYGVDRLIKDNLTWPNSGKEERFHLSVKDVASVNVYVDSSFRVWGSNADFFKVDCRMLFRRVLVCIYSMDMFSYV